MSTNKPGRRGSKKLPKATVVLGRQAAEELFAALAQDLFDQLPETQGFVESIGYETIVSVYPQRYRDVTECIVNDEPEHLLSLANSWYAEPHPVKVWAKCAADGMKALPVFGPRRSSDPCIELLDRNTATCIRSLRQYFGFYSRLTVKFDLTDPKIQKDIAAFVDRVTRDEDVQLSDTFYALAALFWEGFDLSGMTDTNLEFFPQHGPGAVAEKGVQNYEKGLLARNSLPWLLGRGIHLDPYALRMPMGTDALSDEDTPDFLWDGTEFERPVEIHPSRLILVPKDFRGPRFIAAEPCALQYLQGGIDALLDVHIRRSFLANVFRVHDQSYQRDAALRASTDRDIVTIDMKDASDLVRVKHIEALCKSRPDILDVFMRVRSGACLLPSGKVVTLTSFVTMGAKLCFKLEGIVFALIDLAAIIDHDRDVRGWRWFTRFTKRFVKDECSRAKLGVYGDDQLFLRIYFDAVTAALRKAGFTVNLSKCCHVGAFREACGVDAWNGYDVSVVRPRALPGAEKERQSLSGHAETIENLANKGYLRSAVCLWRLLASKRVTIPIVPSSCDTRGCVHSDILYWMADGEAQTRPSRYGKGSLGSTRVWTWVQTTDFIQVGFDEGAYWDSLRPHSTAAEPMRYPGQRVFLKRCLSEHRGDKPKVFTKQWTF